MIVVGGGAAAVSSAANVARTWPGKRVALYFPGERALPYHHPRVWETSATPTDRRRRRASSWPPRGGPRRLRRAMTSPVRRSNSAPDSRLHPQTRCCGRSDGFVPTPTGCPPELLDEHGFVRVTPELRVPDHRGVFAIGDVAATDPLRTSARNRADGLLVRNILAEFADRPLRSLPPASRRWGSVIGIQPDGLEVFAPNGQAFRFPAWSFERVLMSLIVRRGIYHGVRDESAAPVVGRNTGCAVAGCSQM